MQMAEELWHDTRRLPSCEWYQCLMHRGSVAVSERQDALLISLKAGKIDGSI